MEDLKKLAEKIVGEMQLIVKDIHKIPSETRALNRHAYKLSVLIDLSTVLERILPYVDLNSSEQKYRLMARKDAGDR